MKRLISLIAVFSAVLTFSAQSANAVELKLRWLSPTGEVLQTQSLNLNELDALKQQEIVTTTPWTEGQHSFTGPSLETLAGLAEYAVSEARVTALNDYTTDIPASDWQKMGAILASRLDGETMRVRDKGPYWLMYPIDSLPELNSQRYHARMVWQVNRIDFLGK